MCRHDHGDIRLRQVLGNLVNNAVKFTDSGAVLLSVTSVHSADSQASLEFSVTDTGLGVAADEQQRIFEAFEQADGSITRKFGGTGLGLAISRQLVDLMHGTMGLQSSLGHGSRFFFRIPASSVSRIELPPVEPAQDLAALVIACSGLQSAVLETCARMRAGGVVDS